MPALSPQAVSELLAELAALRSLSGGNPFATAAYSRAAQFFASYAGSLEGDLTQHAGIGGKIASVVAELLATGTSEELLKLRASVPDVRDLTLIPGIGWKKALKFHAQHGIKTRAELAALLASGAVPANEKLSQALAFSLRESLRLPRAVVLPRVQNMLDTLRLTCDRVQVAGSMRRHTETVKDVDILVTTRKPKATLRAFHGFGELVVGGENSDTQKSSIFVADGSIKFRVDLLLVPPAEWGSALLYFTGSRDANVAFRSKARAKGLTVSEHGVFKLRADGSTGKLVASATEREMYEAVGVAYHSPWLREGSQLLSAEQLRGVVRRSRVDLHMHTHASDGKDSVEDMVKGAIALGHTTIAITDHVAKSVYGHDLYAHPAALHAHFKEIAKVKAKYASEILVLAGAEVDVDKDGNVDVPEGLHDAVDFLIASCHQPPNVNLDARWQTVLARHKSWPKVRMLGHPTGRVIGGRPPGEANWQTIFETAAKLGVAIEVNGQPSRLDLPETLLPLALRAGCLLAPVSDAHSASGLSGLAYAVKVLQRGRVPKRRALTSARAVQRWLAT